MDERKQGYVEGMYMAIKMLMAKADALNASMQSLWDHVSAVTGVPFHDEDSDGRDAWLDLLALIEMLEHYASARGTEDEPALWSEIQEYLETITSSYFVEDGED